jgi:hypothetical protein
VANIKQPFAIRILTWFAGLASTGMFLSIFLVLLNIGPAIMGGEHVTRNEWLRIAAPLVAAMGVLMALVCYALAHRKPWSRHIVIAMFSLIIVYATILGTLNLLRHSIMWRALINATVVVCLSCWYFYLKPNVVQYFRTLKDASKL